MRRNHFFTKFISCLLTVLMLIPILNLTEVKAVSSDFQENNLNLQVKSAIAIDANSGQLLYAKNANKDLPIASMTKLITVYLTLKAIEEHKLSWTSKVTPTKAIVEVSNNSEYSNVPLKTGHSYTIKQLFQATLIESANGAAMCLGQAISGNQKDFVDKMRAQVKAWGINDAKIYTACGLPNGYLKSAAYPGASKSAENTMSAKDMAIIGQELLKTYPNVLKTTKIAHLAFKDQKTTTQMSNFNWMLPGLSQYDAAYKIDGLKTGTTDKAGACFIGTLKTKNSRIITVVMGARHQSGSDPARFMQTKKLLNWIFNSYRSVIYQKDDTLAGVNTVKVHDGDKSQTEISLKQKFVVWDPVDGKPVKASLSKQEVSAPIKKGDTITSYQFESGKTKLVNYRTGKNLNAPAKANSDNNEVNIFVKIWRFITGAN